MNGNRYEEYSGAPIAPIPLCEYCEKPRPIEDKECIDCQYEYGLELLELCGSFEETDKIYK